MSKLIGLTLEGKKHKRFGIVNNCYIYWMKTNLILLGLSLIMLASCNRCYDCRVTNGEYITINGVRSGPYFKGAEPGYTRVCGSAYNDGEKYASDIEFSRHDTLFTQVKYWQCSN